MAAWTVSYPSGARHGQQAQPWPIVLSRSWLAGSIRSCTGASREHRSSQKSSQVYRRLSRSEYNVSFRFCSQEKARILTMSLYFLLGAPCGRLPSGPELWRSDALPQASQQNLHQAALWDLSLPARRSLRVASSSCVRTKSQISVGLRPRVNCASGIMWPTGS